MRAADCLFFYDSTSLLLPFVLAGNSGFWWGKSEKRKKSTLLVHRNVACFCVLSCFHPEDHVSRGEGGIFRSSVDWILIAGFRLRPVKRQDPLMMVYLWTVILHAAAGRWQPAQLPLSEKFCFMQRCTVECTSLLPPPPLEIGKCMEIGREKQLIVLFWGIEKCVLSWSCRCRWCLLLIGIT